MKYDYFVSDKISISWIKTQCTYLKNICLPTLNSAIILNLTKGNNLLRNKIIKKNNVLISFFDNTFGEVGVLNQNHIIFF